MIHVEELDCASARAHQLSLVQFRRGATPGGAELDAEVLLLNATLGFAGALLAPRIGDASLLPDEVRATVVAAGYRYA